MKKIILSFLIILIFYSANAQYKDHVFRVMISSGKNYVKRGENWVLLRTGTKLLLEDQVKVEQNSFLGLAHVSGKALELKKPGIYLISQLGSKINVKALSATQKYTEYLMAQMNTDREKRLDERMNVVAAAERGEKSAFVVFLPTQNPCNLMQNVYEIKWHPVKDTKNYIVKFMNLYDEVILKIVTSDTSFVLDLKKPELKNEDNFKFTVQSKEKLMLKSREYGLKKLNAPEFKSVQEDLNNFKTDDDNSSLHKMVLATYYEDKKLYLNAIENYEKAIELEPEVAEYKKLYAEFLKRNGMAEEKK